MTEQATIEELARAADDAGARLADGVNDLAERLTPRRIMDDALNAAKSRGTELARDAGDLVKAHPVVVGAAVAAVGLAVYAGGRISRAELNLNNDLSDYTDYDDDLPAPSAAAAVVADGAADARELVAENPVLAILAGLAAGAALAMLFPSSDSERRNLGALAKKVTGL